MTEWVTEDEIRLLLGLLTILAAWAGILATAAVMGP